MGTVEVPNLLWYGNEPRTLTFPERWDVELLEPPGFRKPVISRGAISAAFDNPVGCDSLAELAANASEAVIVFDDITRPTPVKDVLPWVLGPIEEAGIPRENIRFIPALGMHGAMNNLDFRKKLGEDVVRDYPIYNHNSYDNCDYLGESPTGVPVYINREYMSCDLRIAIGCITPHVHVGFGGGGKIVLPGIAGAQTIEIFHRDVMARDPGSIGMGSFDGNVMYEEVVEVVKMAGLQVKVDALINGRGEITDLFVGDPVQEHAVGVKEAKKHYSTAMKPGKDIVVTNAYGKYNEMAICMLMAISTVNYTNGTIVIIVDAPEGQVCHYLMRIFGKDYGGPLYLKREPIQGDLKVIVCSAYPDRTMCDLFAPVESVTITGDWEETLPLLEERHPGRASIAVIPDGTMQYFGG